MSDFNHLPEIIATLQERVNAAVLETVDTLVIPAAKARVPVRTGRLRDAIHSQVEVEGVYVIAGDKDAFYGHIVEHGSVTAAPHPFLVPALEEHSEAIIAAVREAIS